MSDKTITLDIWGCCISRDIFNSTCRGNKESGEKYGYKFKINNYFQDCSFISAFSDHIGPDISFEDFEDLNIVCSRFIKKCSIIDFNKNITELMINSGSEWLIIDFRYFVYGIKAIVFDDGRQEYICSKNLAKVDEILRNKGCHFSVRDVNYDEIDYCLYFERMIDFIKKRYGNNVILIETREAEQYLDIDGDIMEFGSRIEDIVLEYNLNLHFIKSTNCYVIKTPINIIGDRLQLWGFSSAHYLSEYYEYAYNAINQIIRFREECYRQLDILYLEACSKIYKIRAGEEISLNNTYKRIKNDMEEGDGKIALELCKDLVKSNKPEGYIYMGRAYRDGKGVETDLNLAAEWMRRAVEKNVGWAKNELFDILWRIGTPEAYEEMIDVITTLAKKGDRNAMGRLGRAYRDGKGVETDLNLAAEWMRNAVDKDVGWAKNELFDILWRIGTPEAYEEMINVATDSAEKGDGGGMGRLGRAYRDGKGVETDLNLAAHWMRRAAEKNIGWAKNELFDILWRIGTPEAYEEMINVATDSAEKGDGGGMGRLGRAYRDGRGVQQDLNKAAEWMGKAAVKFPSWNKELENILSQIDVNISKI